MLAGRGLAGLVKETDVHEEKHRVSSRMAVFNNLEVGGGGQHGDLEARAYEPGFEVVVVLSADALTAAGHGQGHQGKENWPPETKRGCRRC